MSKESAPPSYNETMQQTAGFAPPPGYGGGYGAAAPAQPGAMGHPPPHPPGGAYPPAAYDPKGYYPPQQGGYQGPVVGGYQQTGITVTQSPQQTVVLVGGCPACRVGVLEDDFTCLGVLCAILCFPLGVLCCLALRQRRCSHCGAIFG